MRVQFRLPQGPSSTLEAPSTRSYDHNHAPTLEVVLATCLISILRVMLFRSRPNTARRELCLALA
eukprot:scaffold243365_cov33-Tisochrysis_lutea.AAC.1